MYLHGRFVSIYLVHKSQLDADESETKIKVHVPNFENIDASKTTEKERGREWERQRFRQREKKKEIFVDIETRLASSWTFTYYFIEAAYGHSRHN